MKKQLVSFVIPCYRSAETIGSVVDEIEAAMGELERYEYEIILVNDCSPDDTFGKIRELCGKDKRIKGINLARNFGQHAALMAGFHQVKGDILVCLDDDGQTPANEVGKLLAALENGADVAYAKYEHKHHSAFRNFGSRVNDWMLCFMLNKPKDLFISSYFAARRFVLEEMLKYENAFPYVIGLVLRATRNIVNVTVEHRDRMVGESGYTFGKLLALWFNGFTAFSEKPLRIATMAGVGCAGLGFLYGIFSADGVDHVYRRNADADAGADRRICRKNVHLSQSCAAVCGKGDRWWRRRGSGKLNIARLFAAQQGLFFADSVQTGAVSWIETET